MLSSGATQVSQRFLVPFCAVILKLLQATFLLLSFTCIPVMDCAASEHQIGIRQPT